MWFKKKEEKTEEDHLFTKSWMDKWEENLNESHDFKKKAVKWNERIILKATPVSGPFEELDATGIWINIQYGKCVEMRYATTEDEPVADVIISADLHTWSEIIHRKKDPTMYIMKKRIKLEKGSLVMLSTKKKAVISLIEQAPSSESYLPEKVVNLSEKLYDKKDQKREYKTTGKGLDFDSFPMQLFQKAKKYGIWNPADISFEQDKADWNQLDDEEKNIILHLSSLFLAGEEAVTLDLIPLIRVVALEKRIEEEIFLTSFLWEEAKHTEFFSICMKEIFQSPSDLDKYHGPFYRTLFYQKLPHALNALELDASPTAQLKAAGTYNIIVEGTLAETGYAAFEKMLRENSIMPGIQEGIGKLKQDESRHIAYGLFLINRLLKEHPDERYHFENELEELLNDATNIIFEIFQPYDQVPFGLDQEWFLNYAIKQFQHRMNRITF
ncbi:MAG: R2-like ligand-binding oxidase [Balneolaceae bacterium]|nr:R2-like ligand-binding oxidase [Balneolaceae bacterium]MCH8548744.1 R2-like ligand-binding oxidase [Balneolaceae bacterium]